MVNREGKMDAFDEAMFKQKVKLMREQEKMRRFSFLAYNSLAIALWWSVSDGRYGLASFVFIQTLFVLGSHFSTFRRI